MIPIDAKGVFCETHMVMHFKIEIESVARHGHLVKFHPFSLFFVYGPGCSVCLYAKGAKRRISLPML